jgi:hypothetical protein
MGEHEAKVHDEVRAVLLWMADLVDPATDTRSAVRRARRRLARTLTASALSLALCVYGGFAAVAAFSRPSSQRPHPISSPPCDSTWAVVPSADLPGQNTELAAVAALGHKDVWGAGYSFYARPHYRPLIEHWDGTRWTVVPGARTKGDGLLIALAASGPHDVWAGGSMADRVLLEHWDGSTWSVMPVPTPGTSGFVGSLTVITPNDVWAVGGFEADGRSQTLALHWDGTAWTVVPTPNVESRDTTLNPVAAVGGSEAWAVGYSLDRQGSSKPFAIRWDGDAWRVVSTPNPDDGGMLADVGAHQDGTVWAVGTNDAVTDAIILRWEGSGWLRMPSPVEGANLIGVSAFDPSDALAYGNSDNFTTTLIAHWDGASWTKQAAPSPGSSFNGISDIQQAGGWRWAVGASTRGGATHTLVLRRCTGP